MNYPNEVICRVEIYVSPCLQCEQAGPLSEYVIGWRSGRRGGGACAAASPPSPPDDVSGAGRVRRDGPCSGPAPVQSGPAPVQSGPAAQTMWYSETECWRDSVLMSMGRYACIYVCTYIHARGNSALMKPVLLKAGRVCTDEIVSCWDSRWEGCCGGWAVTCDLCPVTSALRSGWIGRSHFTELLQRHRDGMEGLHRSVTDKSHVNYTYLAIH